MEILYIIAAYLVGAIPTGKLIVHKIKNVDITQLGSGNIGASNVARIAGFRYGMITFIFDMFKGFFFIALCSPIFNKPDIDICFFTGLAVVLGNQFSIFMKFKGGKGVATGFGVCTGLLGILMIIPLSLFFLVAVISKFSSLASLLAALSTPFVFFFYNGWNSATLLASIITCLIILRHHENITRLINGTENKIHFKKY